MSILEMLRKLFGFKPSMASLSTKSDKIFDVFTKTQKECEVLNLEIVKSIDEKKEKAQILLNHVATLESIVLKNDNLAKKINTFINS